MGTYREKHIRSVVKAISWRIIATLSTMLIVFAFTQKVALSLSIGMIEVSVKLILYYLHERVWVGVPFGKFTTNGAKPKKEE